RGQVDDRGRFHDRNLRRLAVLTAADPDADAVPNMDVRIGDDRGGDVDVNDRALRAGVDEPVAALLGGEGITPKQLAFIIKSAARNLSRRVASNFDAFLLHTPAELLNTLVIGGVAHGQPPNPLEALQLFDSDFRIFRRD